MADEIIVHAKVLEADDFDRGKREPAGSAAQYQVRIAEIEMEFGEFDASLAGDEGLREDLQVFFQRLADERFGVQSVIVKVELRSGSLIVTALVVGGPALYKFFKDYEQLRKGVQLFVGDVKAAKNKIEAIILKRDDKRARK